MALLRVTDPSEFKILEMRLETLNTFNHAQFFGPTSVNAGISSPSFGQIASTMPNRVMQVGREIQFLSVSPRPPVFLSDPEVGVNEVDLAGLQNREHRDRRV